MARSDVPDALQMKALKYGDRPDAEKDGIAARLREADRRSEAVLLFEGRPEHPFLQEEKRWAVEEGCAFHLLTLRRMGVPVTEDDLCVCAQTAERRGRWMDARQCWLVLEDEAGLQRVAPHVPEGLRPEPAEEEAPEETNGS